MKISTVIRSIHKTNFILASIANNEGLDGGVWNSLISKNLAHYSLSLKFLLILFTNFCMIQWRKSCLKGNGSFHPLSCSPRVVSPLSRFAPESFRPPLRESFRPPTLSRFAHYLMSHFAHFLKLYFIEDIVKNLQFLFPSMKFL